MVLPRTSAFGSMFRSYAARTARLRSPTQTWRTAGRRTYASDHGPAKKSSDLPWMIGSVAVTVPSAAWLWQQGPKTGDHGHGHDDHKSNKEHKEDGERSKDESGVEGKDQGEETTQDEAETKSDEGGKDDGSSDSGSDESDTPATSDDDEAPEGQVPKGTGEKVKGPTRPKSETKGEKDAKKDVTGASNPYLADPEKSKKGEGITDSAKIVGTVDPERKVREPGDPQRPEKMDKSQQANPSNINR